MAVDPISIFFGLGSFFKRNKADREAHELMKAQLDLETRQVAYQDWVNRQRVKERGDVDALRKFGVDVELGADLAGSDLENLAIDRARGIRDDYGAIGEEQISQHFLPGDRTSQIDAARDARVSSMMAGVQPTINKFTGKDIPGAPSAWVNAANQVPALQNKLAQFKADRIGDISSAMQDTDLANVRGGQDLAGTERRQKSMSEALATDTKLGKKPIDDEVRKKTREISKSRSEIARGYDIPEKVFHSPDSTAYHKAKAGAAKWDAIGSIASSFFS